jgi:hypothetical protein
MPIRQECLSKHLTGTMTVQSEKKASSFMACGVGGALSTGDLSRTYSHHNAKTYNNDQHFHFMTRTLHDPKEEEPA